MIFKYLFGSNKKIISSHYDFDELSINHEMNYIIETAFKIMELLNIPVIKSEGMIELWSYHPSGNKLS